jgi:GT2 family glycosyltransferase
MLIAIPLWDTVENRRSQLTQKVIPQLLATIRPTDRVIVSDNGSCAETKCFLGQLHDPRLKVIHNPTNLGIAGGTNVAWKEALPGEVVCKMDNDCFIKDDNNWPELIETVFALNPDVGILGLKRKDVAESPTAAEPHYRSKLFFADHVPGGKWIVLEEVQHVMGTCYCFNPKMLPDFGYLSQPGTVYGFDDSLAAVRAQKLGYKTCFLPQVEIDHLDPDNTQATDPYVSWKSQQAGEGMLAFHQLKRAIQLGIVSPYYNGGF